MDNVFKYNLYKNCAVKVNNKAEYFTVITTRTVVMVC